MIRKYFNNEEFLNVINSMFYSKLYYASQVWLIPSLNKRLKSKLLSISSHALKLIVGNDYSLFSFLELHTMFARATPSQWANYSMANQLFTIINSKKPENLWIKLQINLNLNERTDNFLFTKSNVKKVGLNAFSNRLSCTQNLKFNDFNLSKESFKIKIKKSFIM